MLTIDIEILHNSIQWVYPILPANSRSLFIHRDDVVFVRRELSRTRTLHHSWSSISTLSLLVLYIHLIQSSPTVSQFLTMLACFLDFAWLAMLASWGRWKTCVMRWKTSVHQPSTSRLVSHVARPSWFVATTSTVPASFRVTLAVSSVYVCRLVSLTTIYRPPAAIGFPLWNQTTSGSGAPTTVHAYLAVAPSLTCFAAIFHIFCWVAEELP